MNHADIGCRVPRRHRVPCTAQTEPCVTFVHGTGVRRYPECGQGSEPSVYVVLLRKTQVHRLRFRKRVRLKGPHGKCKNLLDKQKFYSSSSLRPKGKRCSRSCVVQGDVCSWFQSVVSPLFALFRRPSFLFLLPVGQMITRSIVRVC